MENRRVGLRHSSVVALLLGLALGFFVRLIVAILEGSALPDRMIVTRFVGAFLSLGVIWAIEGMLQQKPLQDTVLAPRHAIRDVSYGIAMGSAMMCSVVGVLWLSGWYTGHVLAFQLAPWLERITFLFFGALFEEALFRGLAFRRMEALLGSWLSLVVSSALFGLPHLANTGATLGSTIAIALAGAMLGAAYMATGSLWLVVGLHWAWNVVQGPILGLAVSGNGGATFLRGSIQGPSRWTGGEFGPEAGLPCILVSMIAAGPFLHTAIKGHRIVRPSLS